MNGDDGESDDEVSNLEIEEGDLSMVIRSDGEVEFLMACEDEESDQYLALLRMIHYLRFVLESPECRELFDKSLASDVN